MGCELLSIPGGLLRDHVSLASHGIVSVSSRTCALCRPGLQSKTFAFTSFYFYSKPRHLDVTAVVGCHM